MFSLLDLAAILLTLSALFGWLNHKFIPLPHTIGLLVMSVVVSVHAGGIGYRVPWLSIFDALTTALLQIDFTSVVMNGMLAFLLFAGALHVDLGKLRGQGDPRWNSGAFRYLDLNRASSALAFGMLPG